MEGRERRPPSSQLGHQVYISLSHLLSFFPFLNLIFSHFEYFLPFPFLSPNSGVGSVSFESFFTSSYQTSPPPSSDDSTNRANLLKNLENFYEYKKLDLLLVMFSSTSEKDGFRRELVIYSPCEEVFFFFFLICLFLLLFIYLFSIYL